MYFRIFSVKGSASEGLVRFCRLKSFCCWMGKGAVNSFKFTCSERFSNCVYRFQNIMYVRVWAPKYSYMSFLNETNFIL